MSDLFDAHYREYHPTQGRWITPDPAGLAAVDPSNPQSWNRYAYVLNNPLSNTDPLGLDDGCQSASDDSSINFDCILSTDNGGSGSEDQPWWSNGQLNLSAIPPGYSGPLGGGYYWSNGYLGFLSSPAMPSAPASSSSSTGGSSSPIRAVGTAISNSWLMATAPIGRASDWVNNHPLVSLPIAVLAAFAGNEEPIEEDAAIVEEGIPVVEQGVTDKLTQAANAIEEWLGPNYKPFPSPTSDLGLKSEDGLRTIRFDLTNAHGLDPHVNLETWQPRNLYPGDKRMLLVDSLHIFLQP